MSAAAEGFDIDALRQRLARAEGPAYWRCLEEAAGDARFQRWLERERPRLAGLWQAPAIDRRAVLKLMAASLALAGVTACGQAPQEAIVPYVQMPESLLPGVPRHYASSLEHAGEGIGVLVETREGRPVKVEGNPAHPGSRGATDTYAQAALLSLYDPDRSRSVRRRGTPTSWAVFAGELLAARPALQAGQGEGFAILTGDTRSPSVLASIEALRNAQPQLRWYRHDAGRPQAPGAALADAFGTPHEPRYHFERAELIVSLDGDFLGTLPGHLRYGRDYLQRRREQADGPAPTRLYAFECTPTLTGAKADHCVPAAPAALIGLARALAGALAGEVAPAPAAPPGPLPLPPAAFAALVADLRRAGPAALVVPGEQQPAQVQVLAHAINAALGAAGRTVSYHPPDLPTLPDLAALVADAEAGMIDTLLILGANPVHQAPADLPVAPALGRIRRLVHLGSHLDETAALATWHVPEAHPLEAWGDTRAFDGTIALQQPTIAPLFGGRTALEVLGLLAGEADPQAYRLLRAHWRERLGEPFESRWFEALREGVLAAPDGPAGDAEAGPDADWRAALAAADSDSGPDSAPAAAAYTLLLRPDPAIWDGRYANNAWLQELPRPLTKLTWHNAVLIAPADAEVLDLADGDHVTLTAGEHALTAPIWRLPGQPAGVLTLTLGYGRRAGGQIGTGVGVDAYRLRTTASPAMRTVGLHREAGHTPLASTQQHHRMAGEPAVREVDLAELAGQAQQAARAEPSSASLYPEPSPREGGTGHAWAMSIDLTACIGCNACVIACQAENNIPVVGEREVRRGREMHWLRVDRYYRGPLAAPATAFQPVPCMHCENAPCEYVCPVEATQHSHEGLNEMIYNRCIGTRYCSQNCPYKVRRFNWFDYTEPAQPLATPAPAHNPDVSVRVRGVMEKCTYCVQRINRARIAAGRDGRALVDGDVRTACQSACPTEAIVFGDLADPASAVAVRKRQPLDYALLAGLNARPRTTYLAAVRNPNPQFERALGRTRKPAVREPGVPRPGGL
ncbi:MAG TPA: TAT-variant-translocated molybdopterin oxidoreductase [Gammaproteobacteria bacterium]|nr:TAT-variant-translocated molybdopterin oxidoreductase [Gammaproteobacteria bacterium]